MAAEPASRSQGHQLQLRWLPGTFAVCRLPPSATLNPALFASGSSSDFVGVIKTKAELSILAPSEACSGGWVEEAGGKADGGWVGLEVQGPMAFDMVGVMAQLASTLAAADVSLLAQSSFDTDYIFVKEGGKPAAHKALVDSGCLVV